MDYERRLVAGILLAVRSVAQGRDSRFSPRWIVGRALFVEKVMGKWHQGLFTHSILSGVHAVTNDSRKEQSLSTPMTTN